MLSVLSCSARDLQNSSLKISKCILSVISKTWCIYMGDIYEENASILIFQRCFSSLFNYLYPL